AEDAAPALRQHLEAAGARVDAVVAYRNVAERPQIDLAQERIDAVAFAFSGTAERFVAAAGPATIAALTTAGTRCYAIGPETAAGMARLGLPCASIAAEASVAALAEAIIADLARPAQ
ncbi:MAG: uroporphyrinogen-III synthase, partial [Planctomycetes bacterium]|nr:uroporphyrinogen-III synthase [Planctomycetota bacterium]